MLADQSGKDIVALIAVKADGSLTVQDRSNKPVTPCPWMISFSIWAP